MSSSPYLVGAMPRAKKPTQDAGPSSGKRKAPSKRTSKQLATYDDTKFETEDAWLAYKNYISRRIILPERRVLTSDFANELLGHIIARNQWESFVATSRVAYVEIVKEFYVNIHENLDIPDHPQYRQVYVRGQYIPFSPMEILRYYGLDNMEADIFHTAHTNPHEVVTSLCHGIDHWPNGSSTLDYRSLLPQVRTLDKMNISAGVSGPALNNPMPEDPLPPATEPTLASISHELHEWHASHASLEVQIREIRETQVHEAEARRREHEVLSAQMTQLLGFFSLYSPPPPQ
ncbi:putative S-locus lectin protein kinase family protein [Abeliophyllum distichum]|uniref:S-locus lectin protein kinase family protein n=1 Tax=Abeliophyllum distichum TaxID=126358 RepID=A0ABD1S9I2_9LAMI